MKRLLTLIIASILVVCLLAGCGDGVKTYVDSSKKINTSVNQEFVIALDANPTTGYDWEESHDESMLSLVEDRYVPDEKAPGLVGAGGTQYFHFKALKAGETDVTVTYKRPWETDIADQKTFSVAIK